MFRGRRGFVAGSMLIVLAACAATNHVVTFRHGETGETAVCREQSWADQSRAKQAQDCVAAYVISCRVEPGGQIDRKRKMEACIATHLRDGYVIVEAAEAEKKQTDK